MSGWHDNWRRVIPSTSVLSAQLLGTADLPPLRYTVEKRPKAGGEWREHANWKGDLDGAMRSARYYRVLTRRSWDWRVCLRCGAGRSVLLGEVDA